MAALAACVAAQPALAVDDPSAAANSTMRDKALAWLIKNQQRTGEWRNVGNQPTITTGMALQGMSAAGYRGDFFQRSLGWLASRGTQTIEGHARLIMASGAGGLDPAPLCQALLARAHPAGGWGAGAVASPVEQTIARVALGDGASYMDTALALDALRRAGDCGVPASLGAPTPQAVINAVGMLVVNKPANGWSFGPGVASTEVDAVVPTANGILAMSQLAPGLYFGTDSTKTFGARTQSAINWLLTQQALTGVDAGSFDSGSVLSTAIALSALEGAGNGAGVPATNARTWLRSKQAADGSFGSDPLTTGAVLYAFGIGGPTVRFSAADYSGGLLLDANADGLPDRLLAYCNNPLNTTQRCFAETADASLPQGVPVVRELPINTAIGTLNFSGVGGTKPYTGSTNLIAGRFPPGTLMGLIAGSPPPSDWGFLGGTPTEAGRYSAIVEFSDATGKKARMPVSLNVYVPLTLAGQNLRVIRGSINKTYGPLGIGSSNTAGPYTWTISSGSLPTGMALTASTGKVSGTPTVNGSFTATIRATDVDGRFGEAVLQVGVLDPVMVMEILDR